MCTDWKRLLTRREYCDVDLETDTEQVGDAAAAPQLRIIGVRRENEQSRHLFHFVGVVSGERHCELAGYVYLPSRGAG